VPLDRQSIEKRDFPIGRRGYEPAAVDEPLARLAAEVEALQSAPRATRQPESLASAASEQVRAIVQAAETSAADIERQAQAEAARIRDEAARDAQRTREEAVERAQSHIGNVGESTAAMLQRVDAMDGELGALVESLRTGANRLTSDLSLLEGNMGELYSGAGGAPRAVTLPSGPEPTAVVPEPTPELEPEPKIDEEPPVVAAPAETPEPVAPVQDAADGADGDDADGEGAQLIALNMALNGQSREETDRYLAENFDLADRERLLDEVYSSIET